MNKAPPKIKKAPHQEEASTTLRKRHKLLLGRDEQRQVETAVLWRPQKFLLATVGFGLFALAAGFAIKRGSHFSRNCQEQMPSTRQMFLGVQREQSSPRSQQARIPFAKLGDRCANDCVCMLCEEKS